MDIISEKSLNLCKKEPVMNDIILPGLSIGPHTAQYPIIQGGMGVGISLSGLSSAVAEQGGIGVISAVGIGMLEETGKKQNITKANQTALAREIRAAREKTDGIIGCNIMVALSDYFGLVSTALDEKIDILFLGAGLPLHFPKTVTPEQIKFGHTRFVPIISSARALDLIFKYWDRKYKTIPDAVVVEGPMAGGHLGFKPSQIHDPAYSLESLLEEVLSMADSWAQTYGRDIPVIAAGGIYTGADIHRMISMGASGVQMGTRFVATAECDADIQFKKSYIQAEKDDITIINSPVGLPGRAIQNRFLLQAAAGARHPFSCPWKCLKTCDFRTSPYCIARALTNARYGDVENGFVFAGENAWRVDSIITVKELFSALRSEYIDAVFSASETSAAYV